jgi:hypothetical protein
LTVRKEFFYLKTEKVDDKKLITDLKKYLDVPTSPLLNNILFVAN